MPVVNAGILFIWAAIVCGSIREGTGYAAKRLLMMSRDSISTLAPEHYLNNVYSTGLKSTIHDEYLEAKKEDKHSVLKQVLGTVVLLYKLSFHRLRIDNENENENDPKAGQDHFQATPGHTKPLSSAGSSLSNTRVVRLAARSKKREFDGLYMLR